MYVALASVSTDPDVSRPLLEKIAESIEYQLHAHYARMWQSSGVDVRVFSLASEIPHDGQAYPLVVFDEPDQAGALGYHSVDPQGRGYGKAFWEPLRENSGTLHTGPFSLSVTLSHEALEMVGDPYTNFWAETASGELEAIELCDRVEADSYVIGGDVAVSNFLGPRAFRDGDGPFDHLGLLVSPWEIREGGYAIRRKGDGDVFEVFGEHYPSWKRATKRFKGARTARRLAKKR